MAVKSRIDRHLEARQKRADAEIASAKETHEKQYKDAQERISATTERFFRDLQKTVSVDYETNPKKAELLIDSQTALQDLFKAVIPTLAHVFSETIFDEFDAVKVNVRKYLLRRHQKTTASDYLRNVQEFSEFIFDTAGGPIDIGFAAEYPAWMQIEIKQYLSETFSQPYWGDVIFGTIGDINSVIERGVIDGWSTQKIASEIAGNMLGSDSYSKMRGMRIARTEAGHALNGARNAAMMRLQEEVDLPMKRVWLSVLGTTTRDSHAHLDGVPENKDGVWELAGVEARHPGDVSLPASERINCQCTLHFKFGMTDEHAQQELDAYAERIAGVEKAHTKHGTHDQSSHGRGGGGGKGTVAESDAAAAEFFKSKFVPDDFDAENDSPRRIAEDINEHYPGWKDHGLAIKRQIHQDVMDARNLMLETRPAARGEWTRLKNRYDQWNYVNDNPLSKDMIAGSKMQKRVNTMVSEGMKKRVELQKAKEDTTEGILRVDAEYAPRVNDVVTSYKGKERADKIKEILSEKYETPEYVAGKKAKEAFETYNSTIAVKHMGTKSNAPIISDIDVSRIPQADRKNSRSRVRGAAEDAEAFVRDMTNTDLYATNAGMVNFNYEEYGSRANYTPMINRIQVNSYTDTPVFAHEIAHHLDHSNPAAMRRTGEFLSMRVKRSGKPDFDMGIYGEEMAGEIGNEDGFVGFPKKTSRAYAGKRYESGSNEIMPMGVEQLMRNPLDFSSKDPEYAAFVGGVLSGELLGVSE